MNFEMTTLQNGLRVISSSRPEIETVSVGIWIKTGSAFETEDMNGISHFLEHLVFKGTKSRDTIKISEDIEDKGGHMNAYTGREFTAFYAKMLKDDAELAIDVLAELITSPTFPMEELKKEQDVIVQEIKQTIDDPDDIIFDYLQEKAFPNQAIGRDILGTEKLIRSFDADTLRKYISTNYAAENMVVCAVGNITHENLVKMTEQRLSGIQPQTSFIPEEQKYAGGFYFEKRDIEQAHVAFGFQGVKYDSEDYYPAVLFTTLFGGGMSSRLFKEIREKAGLVYTVYSFSNSHSQSGLFGIYAGTDGAKVRELIYKTVEEIKKVRNSFVEMEELERAKTQLKASILMNLESTSSTSEVLARQMLVFGRIVPINEMVQRIEKITLEDIKRVANQILSSKPTFALIGAIDDYPDYEELIKILK